MPSEIEVLAHMMERTRQFTLSYFDRLKDQDLHRKFVCEGKELNTAYWIIAHLAVTENGLLLMATGGPFEKFSWAKHFSVGGKGLPEEECPPFETVLDTFHGVHAKAIAHLRSLPDAALEGPNPTNMTILGPTLRDVITHAIRHEGSHIGHLGWLCKLYGIKTV